MTTDTTTDSAANAAAQETAAETTATETTQAQVAETTETAAPVHETLLQHIRDGLAVIEADAEKDAEKVKAWLKALGEKIKADLGDETAAN